MHWEEKGVEGERGGKVGDREEVKVDGEGRGGQRWGVRRGG